MKKDDCIFCRLANGEIPTNTVYEDESFKVILDSSPATKGHSLILPKEHCDDIFTFPESEGTKLIKVVKMTAKAMKKALSADGVNLVQNNGAAAGQTVSHLHFHVIPRYEDEKNAIVTWTPHETSEVSQKEICLSLSKAMGTD